MSVEDLAIDVGIPKDSDEFDSFVGCIENILEYGCGYADDFTNDVIDKCRKSELDIAKKVVRELERPKSRYRQKKMKWWEEWTPKFSKRREIESDRRSSGQRPSRNARQRPSRNARHMSPVREKRPMSPLFSRRQQSMNLQFDKRRDQRRPQQRRRQSPEIRYERAERKRPMSPMFSEHPSDVPEWPGRKQSPRERYDRRRRQASPRRAPTKRRRFR